ncbi:MAG: hypothetical protein WCK28_00680 [Burkholderiales bacterium]
MTREQREEKLRRDLYELAVDVAGLGGVDPVKQDALAEAFNATRAMVAALHGLDDDAHARTVGAIRRYLWALADTMPAPERSEPKTAAAARSRREIGAETRKRICIAAALLRRREPGITKRQAALCIAEDAELKHDFRRVYDVIREAFDGSWSDPDSGWTL